MINLVSITYDSECPFCKSSVKSGASICAGCGAKYGWKGGGTISFLFGLILFCFGTRILAGIFFLSQVK